MQQDVRKPGEPGDPVTKHTYDGAFWLHNLGALLTIVIFGLCFIAFVDGPWWTLATKTELSSSEMEVSLWYITSITDEQAVETKHEGCTYACDRTRVVSNKQKVVRQKWDDICRHPADEVRTTCIQIWVLRGGLIVSFVLSVLFAAPALLSFAGSRNPGRRRLPPIVAIVICALLLLAVVVVVVTAIGVQTPQKAKLNGWGYYLVAVALAATLPNLLLALLAQKVASIMEASVNPAAEEDTEEGAVTVTMKPPPALPFQGNVLMKNAWS
eukprot:TRINITY_DN32849_c0_g1_i1.p1 TRINITY_DN32849_c0_g1~~TRINITY_DN32849_c0_g1_i1.p1  ORF type:complete len:269 (-),score=40.68 TRINITY_DN32849_c0_g1_i1:119-925(-)